MTTCRLFCSIEDVVECTSATCLSGGTCVELVGGGTMCECPPGFTGADCCQGKVKIKVMNISKNQSDRTTRVTADSEMKSPRQHAWNGGNW